MNVRIPKDEHRVVQDFGLHSSFAILVSSFSSSANTPNPLFTL